MGQINESPLSENENKFDETATSDDCIKDLRKVQEQLYGNEISRVISRNQYRKSGRYSDATWDQHFGTFTEFRRQAGIFLSRQQSKLERDIAKHASVDHYREYNKERADWGDKYVRKNKARFQTILAIADIHDINVDPFWLRVVLDTADRVKPDIICIDGDLFDLPEFGKYTVDPREWDVVGRIKFTHEKVLGPLRKVCPDAQMDLIEGNHEARLVRHLADASPGMRVVLSDLHGWRVGDLFKLNAFELNYIAAADLSAWTVKDNAKELSKNYKIYFDCVMAHHYPLGRQYGMPGFNGHNHKHIVWPNYSPQFGSYEWHQIGCGHRRDASYCEGLKWANGFVLINVDTETKSTSFDYIAVTDHAISGGKWYHRTKEETVILGRK
jgi:hypothetical protein